MKKRGRYKRFSSRKAQLKNDVQRAEKIFPRKEFDEYWKKNSKEVSEAVFEALLDVLASEKIYVHAKSSFGYMQKQELHKGIVGNYCASLPEKMNGNILREMLPGIQHVIYSAIIGSDNLAVVEFAAQTKEKAASKVVVGYLRETKRTRDIVDYVRNNLTELVVFRQLLENPHYSHVVERLKSTMAAKQLLLENLQTSTPDDYTELFPLARQMKRHFILHIGPTNSGKTYQAMEDLRNAKSGIYLAPLRLLAYEQYEKMNREGCPCSMITGEEQIFEGGSFHQSSTIEMLNLEDEWDMAVIDEAQMVSDEQRGGSWTSAILGLRSPVIHLCASPDAEKVLIKMINSCKDSYEITYHERKTPLMMDENAMDFRFPEDVQKGDALIVFSRKDVHSVAAELQAAGVKCSIIYGSLPYDVRHREAGKFAAGETDVVVATDAIGMGMNLPIRRIVFLQTIKFDGVKERALSAPEVKQIAGRAGRYGLYDTGLVTSYYDYWMIENLLQQRAVPIKKAMINIPSEFLEKDGKVSTILELWNQIPAANFYDKGDISEKIKVAKALENIGDNRELIRKCIRIPVNPDNKEIFDIFLDFYRALFRDKEPALYEVMDSYRCEDVNIEDKSALQRLETSSAVYDMLYSFTRFFGQEEDLNDIIEIKRSISAKIFVILDKQKLNLRTCPNCGKKLKWSYKFNICQECYRRGRASRLNLEN
jgi:ATP-dependent RNA helicase SUPV3L1/SUV3